MHRSRAEFVLALATTALIVALPIQQGVGVGIVLSLVYGVSTYTRARLVRFEPVEGTTVWWPGSGSGRSLPGVRVVGFPASLSFLNAQTFRQEVMATIRQDAPRLKLLVLEASGIAEIDYTAAGILRDVIAAARGLGVDFAVARLTSLRAQAAFDRFGVMDVLGADHLFHSVDEAIRTLQPAPPPPPARRRRAPAG
jgi:MFS superfamily sulfate permease-like transporter